MCMVIHCIMICYCKTLGKNLNIHHLGANFLKYAHETTEKYATIKRISLIVYVLILLLIYECTNTEAVSLRTIEYIARDKKTWHRTIVLYSIFCVKRRLKLKYCSHFIHF